jgi:hypothetical protein
VYETAGRQRPDASREARDPYRAAADLLSEHANLDALPIVLSGNATRESDG